MFRKIARKIGVLPKKRFKLRQRLASRRNAPAVRLQIKSLRALRFRRLRKKRRGVRVRFFRRRWWPRLLRRRSRRSRKHYATLNKRKRWRRARRDSRILKRFTHYYQAKAVTVQATTFMRRNFSAQLGIFKRERHDSIAQQLSTPNSSELHAPAVFLRNAFRKLARREKFVARAHERRPRQLRSTCTRLDARYQELSRPSGIGCLIIPLPAPKKQTTDFVINAKSFRPSILRASEIRRLTEYREWRFARLTYKLQTQRQLRSSIIRGKANARVTVTAPLSCVKSLFQLRGKHLSYGSARTFGSRELRNKDIHRAPLHLTSSSKVIPLTLSMAYTTNDVTALSRPRDYSTSR